MTASVEPSPLVGIRLVALDLDGTLLPFSKQLSERARRVTRALRAAGIEVTLATGRGWTHTSHYAAELGLDFPLVTLEGAYVARPTGQGAEELLVRTLPDDARRALHTIVEDLELGFFYTHRDHRTRVHRRLEPRLEQVQIWDPRVDVVDEGLHDHPAAPFVVHVVGEPQAVSEARDRVSELGHPEIDLFHAEFWDGYDQLQVRPAGVAKDSGVQVALDQAGIASSEMLAAGDWMNDLEMLRMARVSVTVSNAPAAVKQASDIVLENSNEQDAVVAFLEWSLERL